MTGRALAQLRNFKHNLDMHHIRLIVLGVAMVMLAATVVTVSDSHPEIGRFLLAQVGSVGLSVGVLPNPYNTLAEQLQAKEQVLNTKEAALNNETVALQAQQRENDIKVLRYSLLGGAFLFLLVLLNFYLDFRARKIVNTPPPPTQLQA